MSVKERLTGEYSHRVQRHWGKDLLVLQVEVHHDGYYHDNCGGRIDTIDVSKTVWRNARASDLKALYKIIEEAKC